MTIAILAGNRGGYTSLWLDAQGKIRLADLIVGHNARSTLPVKRLRSSDEPPRPEGSNSMKIAKLVLGALAAVWTIGVVIGAEPKLFSGDYSTKGITEAAASVGAIAICSLITYWLLSSALRKN
jgi:hypothetical protein